MLKLILLEQKSDFRWNGEGAIPSENKIILFMVWPKTFPKPSMWGWFLWEWFTIEPNKYPKPSMWFYTCPEKNPKRGGVLTKCRFYTKNGTFLQINWQKSTICKHFLLILYLHLGNFFTFLQLFKNYFVDFYNNFCLFLQSTQPPLPKKAIIFYSSFNSDVYLNIGLFPPKWSLKI